MTKVLMVVSSANKWTLRDGSAHPTGVWAEEFVEPYRVFRAAGWDITLATPDGKAPTFDRASFGLKGGLPNTTKKFREFLDSLANELTHPRRLADMNVDDFDVVFYPGGHGPMEDLAYDETSGMLIAKTVASGKPLGLLCHGPAATLTAKNDGGSWLFAGYQITGLSNQEEFFNPFSHKAKWLLEDRLREMGAVFRKGKLPFRPFVVTDRNVYSGQNPASSRKLAEVMVQSQLK